MTLFNLFKGEFGPDAAKTFNLKNSDGTARDLTSKTINMKYKQTAPNAAALVTRSLAIVGAATAGQVKFTPVAADSATVGSYELVIEVSDASNLTVWPAYVAQFDVLSKPE